jgi:uncharacterized protein
MTTSTLTPTAQRIVLLDALRGFAILGIFAINMVAVSWHDATGAEEKLIWFGKAESMVVMALDTLVEGKFYSIFSLLFGIGFGMYLLRKPDSESTILPVFKRRLWALLLIGLAHSLLLWIGDIVFLYAWLGFVLMAFRHKSDQWLLRAAAICLLIPVVLYPLRFIHPYITLGTPFYALLMGISPVLGVENLMEMNWQKEQLAPGWMHYLKINVIGFFIRQADLFDQVRPFKVFAMFLIGFWASRKLWHQDPKPFIEQFKRWLPIVLPIALLINVGMAWISWGDYYNGQWMGWLKTFLYAIGVVPLSLCYVYLFVQAFSSGRFAWLDIFSPVGRMALTNYIFQSVIYMVLMRGVFLGLLGKFSPILCLAIVLLVYPLQILFSKWWLSRYRYGPIEWVWRSLTYRKMQKMRIRD